VREVAHARKRNPLSDLNKILRGGRYPDLITTANFGEDQLRGLGVAGGSKFALLHWLWLSPLQHSRTTVRVCDNGWPPSWTYNNAIFHIPIRPRVVLRAVSTRSSLCHCRDIAAQPDLKSGHVHCVSKKDTTQPPTITSTIVSCPIPVTFGTNYWVNMP